MGQDNRHAQVILGSAQTKNQTKGRRFDLKCEVTAKAAAWVGKARPWGIHLVSAANSASCRVSWAKSQLVNVQATQSLCHVPLQCEGRGSWVASVCASPLGKDWRVTGRDKPTNDETIACYITSSNRGCTMFVSARSRSGLDVRGPAEEAKSHR